jgi:hypothetical protein
MRFGLWAVAVVVSAAAASPAASQDRPGLAPSTAWTLDYADDSCALRRIFGEGEDQVYLEFRRFEPDLGLQTVIGSRRMKARQPVHFTYRFGNEADWQDVTGANTVTLDTENAEFSGVLFNPRFLVLPEYDELENDELAKFNYRQSHDLRAAESQAAASVDSITLRGAFRQELTLQLGRLDAPIKALNQCIDELMTHWGIDVEAHKTLTRPAVPINLPEVGSMIDYPPKMVRAEMQGVVNVRLAIDETGRITSCHIQMPLSDPEFEESSCVDVQHAIDFDPALDKDGTPIASYWVTKVNFVLTD